MTLRVCLSMLLWLYASTVFAQGLTQTIRGKVVDQESQLPLWGANVAVIGTSPLLGAASDEQGTFRIQQVPVGRYTLRISYLGYEDAFVNDLLVGSGKEIVLEIKMIEAITAAEGVTVVAKQDSNEPLNEMTAVSARMFTVEETKRYAASINDPARMAQSFAGVSSSDDLSNEIVVRGNSPMGILWRLEGVEVPNPNHFANTGASGGAVSILSAQMLANSDFLTGAFPAEYGNAFSGVFDIKMRQGNNEKREYTFQAGILGIDASAEGPFKKGGQGSYLFNYRYSTLALFKAIGINLAGDATPIFQDLSFKIHLPTRKAGAFSLWGIGGLSKQVETEPLQPYGFYANMGAAGLSHVIFLDKKTYLESVISLSASQNKYRQDQYETDTLPTRVFLENMINKAVRTSILVNRKISNQHTFRAGAIVSLPSFNLFSEGEDEGVLKRYIDSKGNSAMLQGYAQWKYRINERMTLLSGLHYTHFFLNGKKAIDPRAGLRWQVGKGQWISAGYGMHARTYDMSIYFTQRFVNDRFQQINKNLDLLRAHHYVLGYERLLGKEVRLKAEIYYQQLNSVAIAPAYVTSDQRLAFSILNNRDGFILDSLVSEGSGRNYGLELTLEKSFSKNYYFMTTLSLFESKYAGRDGIERDTRFNTNYILNMLAGKEFRVGKKGKDNILALNLRGRVMGGNRYTPIDLAASVAKGEGVYVWNEAFATQATAYWRIDCRISYRRDRAKHASVLSLDVQNATNRLNVYNQYYDTEEQGIRTSTQSGLIPILSYKIEF